MFKVGDKVRFIKSVIYHNKDVKLGETYTVQDIYGKSYMIENGEWFKEEELVLVDYTYEDLKKSPIGTKVTFEKGNVLLKTCRNKFENETDVSKIDELTDFKDKYYGKIIKIEEPTYTAVYEHKPEILDEAEKRYLRGVIRPFRNRVSAIRKMRYVSKNKESAYIQIQYKDDAPTNFPCYKDGTMYDGMEADRDYTLEELGL